ncbi:hypothetical protein CALCODRAFT_558300 [Calocera cornea HHB12733]|uniref:Autophagy-related protein 17 n=1 Tax=Calocera cornea HHB12733 TaxID=1353952 RepID=A0A165D368_9BASI|nr:hypothetical protein CALCODRAFT_558300 [Calocera cornea HHB12733]
MSLPSPPLPTLIPSLLLTSQHALSRGQQLCTHAHGLTLRSADLVLAALEGEARERWGRGALEGGLEGAGGVVKALGARRGKVLEEIRKWDILRDEATEALDSQLDRMAHMLVPPSMYALRRDGEAEGVDPFDEGEAEEDAVDGSGLETSAGSRDAGSSVGGRTKGGRNGKGGEGDRSRWKNLRDFVDEREVDELVERMEQDRTVLDEALRSPDVPTPHALTSALAHLRSSLPAPRPPLTPTLHALLSQQEDLTSTLSIALESLTTHYEQMQHADSDVRAGIMLEKEDVEVLVRDTQEVGPILEELEAATGQVALVGERLREAAGQRGDGAVEGAWEGLERIRMGMQDLAEHIAVIEETTAAILPVLNAHLAGVNSLQAHFQEVERAYHALVLEMARRAASREHAHGMIRELEAQLDAWRAEESRDREVFMEEAGEWLPEGLCPGMADPPERWDVRPAGLESGVDLPEDLVLALIRKSTA